MATMASAARCRVNLLPAGRRSIQQPVLAPKRMHIPLVVRAGTAVEAPPAKPAKVRGPPALYLLHWHDQRSAGTADPAALEGVRKELKRMEKVAKRAVWFSSVDADDGQHVLMVTDCAKDANKYSLEPIGSGGTHTLELAGGRSVSIPVAELAAAALAEQDSGSESMDEGDSMKGDKAGAMPAAGSMPMAKGKMVMGGDESEDEEDGMEKAARKAEKKRAKEEKKREKEERNRAAKEMAIAGEVGDAVAAMPAPVLEIAVVGEDSDGSDGSESEQEEKAAAGGMMQVAAVGKDEQCSDGEESDGSGSESEGEEEGKGKGGKMAAAMAGAPVKAAVMAMAMAKEEEGGSSDDESSSSSSESEDDESCEDEEETDKGTKVGEKMKKEEKKGEEKKREEKETKKEKKQKMVA